MFTPHVQGIARERSEVTADGHHESATLPSVVPRVNGSVEDRGEDEEGGGDRRASELRRRCVQIGIECVDKEWTSVWI